MVRYVLLFLVGLSFLVSSCSTTEVSKEYVIRRAENMRDIKEVISKDSTVSIRQRGYYIVQNAPTKSPVVVLENKSQAPSDNATAANTTTIDRPNATETNIYDEVIKIPKGGLFNISTGRQIEAVADLVVATGDHSSFIVDNAKNEILDSQKKISKNITDVKDTLDTGLKRTSKEIIDNNMNIQKDIKGEIGKLQTGVIAISNKVTELSKLKESGVYEVTVFFEKNKSALNKAEQKRVQEFLDKVIIENKHRKKIFIGIIGSSAKQKSDIQSYMLAEERAKSVKAFLNNKLVNVDYEIVKVYGTGDDLASKSLNPESAKFNNVLIAISDNKAKLEYLPPPANIPTKKAAKAIRESLQDKTVNTSKKEEVKKDTTTLTPQSSVNVPQPTSTKKDTPHPNVESDINKIIKDNFSVKERQPANMQIPVDPLIKRDNKSISPFGVNIIPHTGEKK